MHIKFNNKKKAFTLIELLIVIAIIGILFIVLVSRVDFATDKAKATGVQTDFRSFQMAFDQAAKENAGFNIFGWDTGDVNGDRIRNSYDRGDTNKNGKEDAGETFTGRKTYGETWTTVYTMLNPDTTKADDTSAFVALEQAINANLDPKLHITITPDVDGGALTGNATITMANQARDPWKNEYHGVFITNADEDGQDRGAIIMYSDGANGKWGSAHDIANGIVSITVPGNNVYGQDDYSIVSCYTYVNGYGEVLNMSTGFSNNQSFKSNGTGGHTAVVPGGNVGNQVAGSATFNKMLTGNCQCRIEFPDENIHRCFFDLCECEGSQHLCYIDIAPVTLSWEELQLEENANKYGYYASKITNKKVDHEAFGYCCTITSIDIPNSVIEVGCAFYNCSYLKTVHLPENISEIYNRSFMASGITSINIPSGVHTIGGEAFGGCHSLEEVTFSEGLKTISFEAFDDCYSLTTVSLPDSVETIGEMAFRVWSTSVDRTMYIGSNLKRVDRWGLSSADVIIYNGTKAQWRQIDLGYGNETAVSSSAQIVCLDGEINNNMCFITISNGDACLQYTVTYDVYENDVLVTKSVFIDYDTTLTIETIANSTLHITTYAGWWDLYDLAGIRYDTEYEYDMNGNSLYLDTPSSFGDYYLDLYA